MQKVLGMSFKTHPALWGFTALYGLYLLCVDESEPALWVSFSSVVELSFFEEFSVLVSVVEVSVCDCVVSLPEAGALSPSAPQAVRVPIRRRPVVATAISFLFMAPRYDEFETSMELFTYPQRSSQMSQRLFLYSSQVAPYFRKLVGITRVNVV